MMKAYNWKKITFLAVLHAILLTTFSLCTQHLHWTFKGEETIIQWSKLIKKQFKNYDVSPSEFLFINTSYSNQLIPAAADNGLSLGNEVITDRLQLGNVISAIRESDKHKWLMVDVMFENKTENDSTLKTEIERIPRIIVSSVLDDKDKLKLPVFNTSSALTTVETLDNKFLKYRLLWNDTLKVMPLIVHEKLHRKEYKLWGPFLKHNQSVRLTTFIPEIRISQFDLTNDFKASLLNLSEIDTLIKLGVDIDDFVKDRIVIVGDFLGNDQFDAVTGEIAGPLLLLNVILALEDGDNRIELKLIIFLIISYFLISILVLLSDEDLRLKMKYQKVVIGSSFLFYLIVVSIVSSFFFNVALSIFILSFYLISANYLREKSKRIDRFLRK